MSAYLIAALYCGVAESSLTNIVGIISRLNEAMWESCGTQFGDTARFLSTAFVARDVDSIRAALNEEELTAYMVSYGTGIGSTYAQVRCRRGNAMREAMLSAELCSLCRCSLIVSVASCSTDASCENSPSHHLQGWHLS